jgi:predicted transposase YdaD
VSLSNGNFKSFRTRMIAQHKAPVITTIIYLFYQRQPEEPVFRVELRGQEINRWQFDCIRLWEIEAQAALDRELPGLAALVPLMKGSTLKRVEQAARQIETIAPGAQQMDLLAILHAFAERQYTVKQLERIIGRERIMESSIYQWGLEEGQARGHAQGLLEGQLMTARKLCRETVRKWRPRAGAKVRTAIEDCTDLAVLEDVTVNAPELSTREILRRLKTP